MGRREIGGGLVYVGVVQAAWAGRTYREGRRLWGGVSAIEIIKGNISIVQLTMAALEMCYRSPVLVLDGES